MEQGTLASPSDKDGEVNIHSHPPLLPSPPLPYPAACTLVNIPIKICLSELSDMRAKAASMAAIFSESF